MTSTHVEVLTDAELDQLSMLLTRIGAGHMLQAAPPEDVLDAESTKASS